MRNPRFISFVLILVLVSLTQSQIAQADNTWISRPSSAAVSFVSPTTTKTGINFSLSTQTTSFLFSYKGSPADSGKFVQFNFFEISPGLGISLAGAPRASSTGCEQQVLNGDSHSCMFALDGASSASILVNLTGVTVSSSFKFIVLSGPNMSQTEPSIVSFRTPKSKISAVTKTAKAMAGTAALVRFRITENGKKVKGMKVAYTLSGLGENLSTKTGISDAQGLVFVYISNLAGKKGTSTIKATIDGTTISTSAKIVWLTGKYN